MVEDGVGAVSQVIECQGWVVGVEMRLRMHAMQIEYQIGDWR